MISIKFHILSIRIFLFPYFPGWWFVAHDNGGQGWAPATYLEPVMSNGTEEDTYDWISVTDTNGKGRF